MSNNNAATMSWDESVSYVQFVQDSFAYLGDNLRQVWTSYRFPDQLLIDMRACLKNNKDTNFFLYIAIMTVAWTVVRQLFTNYFVTPTIKHYQLPESEQEKLPESAWKFFFYSCSWSLAAYILLWKESAVPLLKPTSIFENWSFTAELPREYGWLFSVQLSFYFHSFHATLFMDRWRKDSIVLLAHHLIAVLLTFFTFSVRAHKAATITFFLHDICDILLEGTKCALYFKKQGKVEYPVFETLANIGFGIFTITWLVSRLYFYPLRLVHVCTAYLHSTHLQIPLMFFLTSMLFMLYLMNLYWFTFILKLVFKVVRGDEDLEDSRDYDEKIDSLSENDTEPEKSKQEKTKQAEKHAKVNRPSATVAGTQHLLRKRSDANRSF